jgi:glyoxylase-like metal-dependent hydrolase (beta-lactamase superfamily II)
LFEESLVKVQVIPVTPLAQNCSILVCEATGRAAVVDPGGDVERVLEAVAGAGVQVERVLVTHGHLDHVGAVADLVERLGVPVEGPHPDDRFWLDALPEQSRAFGLPYAARFTPERWLHHGDEVGFGAQRLEVLHCPGHTPGHVVFFHRGDRLALVGDVLFKGSIGRTDFPGGDHGALLRSIREVLWPLGDDVVFVPGHGPRSTFGAERRDNPFVGDGR